MSTKTKLIQEAVASQRGQRICLLPAEVEELEHDGYVVEVESISSFENGKRWCIVRTARSPS